MTDSRCGMFGVAFAGALLAVWSLSAGGCKKVEREKPVSRSKTGTKAPMSAGGLNQPDHVGRYKYNVKFPLKLMCRGDADCGLTQLRPGDCCPDQCGYTAANKGWIGTLRKMHYPTCVKFLRENGFEAVCGRPACDPLPGRARAKCKNGKCAVKYVSFQQR